MLSTSRTRDPNCDNCAPEFEREDNQAIDADHLYEEPGYRRDGPSKKLENAPWLIDDLLNRTCDTRSDQSEIDIHQLEAKRTSEYTPLNDGLLLDSFDADRNSGENKRQ